MLLVYFSLERNCYIEVCRFYLPCDQVALHLNMPEQRLKRYMAVTKDTVSFEARDQANATQCSMPYISTMHSNRCHESTNGLFFVLVHITCLEND